MAPSESGREGARGVVYVVGGAPKYLAEAAHSARSLRRHTPGLPITLVTPLDVPPPTREAFDAVHPVPEAVHPLKAKVRYLLESPYERTLFLDSDTEVRGDVTPLFDALAGHDFAIGHVPHFRYPEDGGPPEFIGYEGPGYNTGVFLFGRSPAVQRLLRGWYEAVADQDEADLWPGHNCDQCRFNEIIDGHVAQGLALRVVPNTVWNAREPVIPYLKREGRLAEVVIYHGRPPLSQPWKWWFYRPARWLKRVLRRRKLVSGGVRLEHLLRRAPRG